MTGRSSPLVHFDVVGCTEQPVGIELEIAAGMAPDRRAEFCSARGLARRALSMLGIPTSAGIGQTETGAPIWPRQATGSISHSGTLIATAVVRESGSAIGIDIEPTDAVTPEVLTSVAAPGELAQAPQHSGLPLDSPILRTAIFCAKEASFKALCTGHQPQIRRLSELRIRMWSGAEDQGTFVAELSADTSLLERSTSLHRHSPSPPVQGRWWRRDDHICALSRTEFSP